MSIKINIGANIRKARLEKHMTQAQLAEMIPVARQTISSYEKGINEPSFDMLELLAERLDVPITFFLNGESEEIKPDHSGIVKCILTLLLIVPSFILSNLLKTDLYSGIDCRFLLVFINQLLIPVLFLILGYEAVRFTGVKMVFSRNIPIIAAILTTACNIIAYYLCSGSEIQPFSPIWIYWELYASSVLHYVVMAVSGILIQIAGPKSTS